MGASDTTVSGEFMNSLHQLAAIRAEHTEQLIELVRCYTTDIDPLDLEVVRADDWHEVATHHAYRLSGRLLTTGGQPTAGELLLHEALTVAMLPATCPGLIVPSEAVMPIRGPIYPLSVPTDERRRQHERLRFLMPLVVLPFLARGLTRVQKAELRAELMVRLLTRNRVRSAEDMPLFSAKGER